MAAIIQVRGQQYQQLVEALAPLQDLSWQLTIVGDRERNPGAAARLDQRCGG